MALAKWIAASGDENDHNTSGRVFQLVSSSASDILRTEGKIQCHVSRHLYYSHTHKDRDQSGN